MDHSHVNMIEGPAGLSDTEHGMVVGAKWADLTISGTGFTENGQKIGQQKTGKLFLGVGRVRS